MAYTAWSVSFGEQPSAAKWNQLGTNDAGFNDGSLILPTITTYSNPGTAGGTNSFRYFTLGDLKFFYGETAAQSTSTSQNDKTVTLPAGFFSTIRYVGATASNMASEARAVMAVTSATTVTVTINFFVIANSGTSKAMVLVIGT